MTGRLSGDAGIRVMSGSFALDLKVGNTLPALRWHAGHSYFPDYFTGMARAISFRLASSFFGMVSLRMPSS